MGLKKIHEGWDYRLYQVYIWGGLALLFAYMISIGLLLEPRNLPARTMFLLFMVPFMVWFTGVLLYWWWVFLFKGRGDLREAAEAQGEGPPPIRSLKSWSTLHEAMAISGGSFEELMELDSQARRPILVWFGLQNFLALWVCGPVVLGALGIIKGARVEIWLIGIVVAIGLMLVGTPLLLSWGSRSGENAYLAPLGLAITQAPGLRPDEMASFGGGQPLIPDGPAVMEGERHGRLVHIETIGKHCLTVLQANLPEFQVRSQDGKLIPDGGAPGAVIKALRSLRKAKRWKGIKVYAGAEGIAVQRQSRGTNMWLYDLWLAEYLCDGIDRGG